MKKINTTAHRPRRGFTLIEATVASIILALAVLSIMAAQQSFHQQNDVAQKTGLAQSLANELREITLPMPVHDPITGTLVFGPEDNETNSDIYVMVKNFDDLDDFYGPTGSGYSFSPPISALREPFPNMADWTQAISVENVESDDVSGSAVTAGSTEVLRITVRVLYDAPDGVTNPIEMSRLSWISAGRAD